MKMLHTKSKAISTNVQVDPLIPDFAFQTLKNDNASGKTGNDGNQESTT